MRSMPSTTLGVVSSTSAVCFFALVDTQPTNNNMLNNKAKILRQQKINEIIKNIILGIMTTRSMKHLKDIPDDQRETLMKYAFKKDKEKK